MNVGDVVAEVEAVGVAFRLDGEIVRVSYPDFESREELASRIALLRLQRVEVAAYLKARCAIPSMPEGVSLVRWEPKPAPVVLTRFAVVTNVAKFISMTLLQLNAALAGNQWESGQWSVRELADRLEQCGVVVKISEADRADAKR